MSILIQFFPCTWLSYTQHFTILFILMLKLLWDTLNTDYVWTLHEGMNYDVYIYFVRTSESSMRAT